MGEQSGHNLHSRVEREEGSSEASGEVGSRLRHSALRARHLGRVAAEEVVHRLAQKNNGTTPRKTVANETKNHR